MIDISLGILLDKYSIYKCIDIYIYMYTLITKWL